MRCKPAVLEPGMWVRQKAGTVWEERAVVLAVDDDFVKLHVEHKAEPEMVARKWVQFAWKVMRPAYRNYREVRRERAGMPAMPSWVVPGATYIRHFDETVYEVVEVRGMWMLAKERPTGVLYFYRASELSNFRAIPTRYQRVL